MQRAKPAGVMQCDGCDVVHQAGKWSWGGPPVGDVVGGLCPACQRIRDRYPAGKIRLHGALLEQRDEIERMIANLAERETGEHPLERVIEIASGDEVLTITTTGVHIARRITSALRRRFHVRGKIRYPEEAHLLVADLGD